jgi:hypothetical protein|tara:strand:- start:644 stop:889 length:246 start_codon:yes stop_codon:yes gene_type:complete
MKIDIKEYLANSKVDTKRSKKAALADMGLSIDDTNLANSIVAGNGRHSNFFAGDYDNAIDGLSQVEDFEDVADCGDEWYLD